MMRILSERQVRQVLDVKTCLRVNKQALIAVANGQADVPTRIGLSYHDGDNNNNNQQQTAAAEDWSLFKPAALLSLQNNKEGATTTKMMGMKLVSIRSQNAKRGLPLVPATILHMNPKTGIVEALLSGTYLTGLRTAASSALAIQHVISRQQTSATISHVVVFGAGLQAKLHVVALCTALQEEDSANFVIPRLTIVNRTLERAEQLRSELLLDDAGQQYVQQCDIVLLDNQDDITRIFETANIVMATTNTQRPLWGTTQSEALMQGDHCIIVTGIGSYTPNMQEIPQCTVDKCNTIYIDTPEASQVGDLKHLQDTDNKKLILLGDTLLDRKQHVAGGGSGRRGGVFFKGVGTAIQDVMTASAVVDRAVELGIGTLVDMDD